MPTAGWDLRHLLLRTPGAAPASGQAGTFMSSYLTDHPGTQVNPLYGLDEGQIRRVVLEVQSGPNPDLQHATSGFPDQLGAGTLRG